MKLQIPRMIVEYTDMDGTCKRVMMMPVSVDAPAFRHPSIHFQLLPHEWMTGICIYTILPDFEHVQAVDGVSELTPNDELNITWDAQSRELIESNEGILRVTHEPKIQE